MLTQSCQNSGLDSTLLKPKWGEAAIFSRKKTTDWPDWTDFRQSLVRRDTQDEVKLWWFSWSYHNYQFPTCEYHLPQFCTIIWSNSGCFIQPSFKGIKPKSILKSLPQCYIAKCHKTNFVSCTTDVKACKLCTWASLPSLNSILYGMSGPISH